MRVLVVDDDIQLASLVAFTLRREGYQVLTAHDGAAGLAVWVAEQPELVVLDVNLPKMDGYAVLKHIREQGATPVIMLTVRGEEEDMVHGFGLGADDYITKPFSPRNLLARVRAVLRRSQPHAPQALSLNEFELDLNRQEVRRSDGVTTKLTPLEFRLLHYLVINQGQVLPTESLIQHIWGYDDGGGRTLLKQLIRRLRLKIEPDPTSPHLIETVAGVGYAFSPPSQTTPP